MSHSTASYDSEMPKQDTPVQLARTKDAHAQHELVCLRLCQAMILIGEKMTSQREFLNRADISRSNAFNLIRGNKEAKPPSARTMTRLAAFCLKESPVPWSSDVSSSIADSLMPALRSYSAWRDWRDRNLALVAFAGSVCAFAGLDDPHGAEAGEDDDERGLVGFDNVTVAGAALVGGFVAYGDWCDGSPQSAASYRQACARFVRAMDAIDQSVGVFARWIRFQALSHKNVLEWNATPEAERRLPETRKRFAPYFKLLVDHIEAGNPTLIAEHVNTLAFASRFELVEKFGLLRDRLEQAWRRHNGGRARPDYTDFPFDDHDFETFRTWLQKPLEDLAVGPTMPTTIPGPTDRGEFDFVAVDKRGHEWRWNDRAMVWDVSSEPIAREHEDIA